MAALPHYNGPDIYYGGNGSLYTTLSSGSGYSITAATTSSTTYGGYSIAMVTEPAKPASALKWLDQQIERTCVRARV